MKAFTLSLIGAALAVSALAAVPAWQHPENFMRAHENAKAVRGKQR